MAERIDAHTPSGLTECSSSTLTWTGGSGPYTVSIEQNVPSNQQLLTVGSVTGNFYQWTVDAPAGAIISFTVTDSENNKGTSHVSDTIRSGDSSCLSSSQSTSSSSPPATSSESPPTSSSESEPAAPSTTTTTSSSTTQPASTSPPTTSPSPGSSTSTSSADGSSGTTSALSPSFTASVVSSTGSTSSGETLSQPTFTNSSASSTTAGSQTSNPLPHSSDGPDPAPIPASKSKSLSPGAIAGIIVAAALVVLVLALCAYRQLSRRRRARKRHFHSRTSSLPLIPFTLTHSAGSSPRTSAIIPSMLSVSFRPTSEVLHIRHPDGHISESSHTDSAASRPSGKAAEMRQHQQRASWLVSSLASDPMTSCHLTHVSSRSSSTSTLGAILGSEAPVSEHIASTPEPAPRAVTPEKAETREAHAGPRLGGSITIPNSVHVRAQRPLPSGVVAQDSDAGVRLAGGPPGIDESERPLVLPPPYRRYDD